MILARVVGTVVATRKDPRLEGKKLLVLKPISPEGKDEAGYVVAVDTVSAGVRERVLAVSGSSARMADGCKDIPVDTAIVGIVDEVSTTSRAAKDLTAEPLRAQRLRREDELRIGRIVGSGGFLCVSSAYSASLR